MRWCCSFVLCGLLAACCMGCAHVISAPVRQQADSTLDLARLRAAPEAYANRLVILGGEILHTSNTPQGTWLEVLHRPLDATGKPRVTDSTEGRFMALCEEYLDPAVYAEQRRITVAGHVQGTRIAPLGDTTYAYPLLTCLELYLWPQPAPAAALYPWGPWGPWSYPYLYYRFDSLK